MDAQEFVAEAALSRSAFFERFVQVISQPPMQYLTQWRMQVASNLLRDSWAPIVPIALEVDHESEAAFTRAFKRLAGVPPGAWRKSQGKESLTTESGNNELANK